MHTTLQLPKSYEEHVVSEGSLHVEDLLFNCLRFLQISPKGILIQEELMSLEAQLQKLARSNGKQRVEHRKNLLFEEVFPLINAMAPNGYYFGMHPGGPGCFGFWPENLRFLPNDIKTDSRK